MGTGRVQCLEARGEHGMYAEGTRNVPESYEIGTRNVRAVQVLMPLKVRVLYPMRVSRVRNRCEYLRLEYV